MKECPNCGYCRYPYDSRNYETDGIIESGIYVDAFHPLISTSEREGPYNSRICGGCGKFYIDNPPMLCG